MSTNPGSTNSSITKATENQKKLQSEAQNAVQEESQMSEAELNKVQDTLQRINPASGKQAQNAIKNILEGALKKGIMPKTALKINDEAMEAVYTQGYNLYGQGKYKEASHVFRLLMLMDFTTPKYVLGLAACAHRLKDYENAANLYVLCSTLDPKNPLPHFHAADCYLQVKLPTIALLSLNVAIKTAGDQSQYNLIKERAMLMQKALEEQIGASNTMSPDEASETTATDKPANEKKQ